MASPAPQPPAPEPPRKPAPPKAGGPTRHRAGRKADQAHQPQVKNRYAAETMLAKSEIHKEALNLPAHERIELVVELWDSLAPTEIPIPDWQRDLIRERVAALADLRPDERSTPWEAAHKRIFSDKA